MESANIILRGSKSHSALLDNGRKSIKFIENRGQMVTDQDVIEYCQARPELFLVDPIVKVAPKPEKQEPKSKRPQKEVTADVDDNDGGGDDDEEETVHRPPARGKRKKVQVER